MKTLNIAGLVILFYRNIATIKILNLKAVPLITGKKSKSDLCKKYYTSDYEDHLNSEEQENTEEEQHRKLRKNCNLCEKTVSGNYSEVFEDSTRHEKNRAQQRTHIIEVTSSSKILRNHNNKKFCDACNMWIL